MINAHQRHVVVILLDNNGHVVQHHQDREAVSLHVDNTKSYDSMSWLVTRKSLVPVTSRDMLL